MQQKIGFDIDGVLCNTFINAHRIVKEKFNENLIKASVFYYPFDLRQETQDNLTHIWHLALYGAKPYKNVVGALTNLIDEGYSDKIYCVTARNPDTDKDLTEKWFDDFFPNIPREIHYIQSDEKIHFLKDNNFTTFVEDRYKTAVTVAKNNIQSFLIDRRHNRGRENQPENVHRVKHVSIACDIFKKNRR